MTVFDILNFTQNMSGNKVWKIINFSITQILREIKIGEFRVSKSAIFTNSDTLNFAFYEFLHFTKAKIFQIKRT